MPSPTAYVLVLAAHPQMALSRVNRALMQAARQAGPRVSVVDLYAHYPDYLIDVAAERARLAATRLLVWLHPIHWYRAPPLMQLWMDEVLSFGWAYGPGASGVRGKDLWLVASTGGPEESYQPSGYNRYHFDAFLPPYEQAATVCGMRFLPPMVMHGAHQIDDAALADHARTFAQRLRDYPAWPELDELADCPACEVPWSARPPEDDAPPVASTSTSRR